MPKWVDEKVLQRYWKDRCNIYEIDGKKIKSAKYNIPFDKYPDVINRLEDDSEVPAEVEWRTSDFNHEPDILKRENGFIIVYTKDQNSDLPQVELDKKDFAKWFKRRSSTLLRESLREFRKEEEKRKFPRIWLRYNDLKNEENMALSLKLGYDGFPEKTKVLPRLRDVKSRDLVLFVGPYKSAAKGRGGRVSLDKFVGTMRRILLMKVTRGYHYDPKPLGWKSKTGELFPHRFCITKSLLESRDLKLEALSEATRSALHHLVATGFWEADPTHFVEILSRVPVKLETLKP